MAVKKVAFEFNPFRDSGVKVPKDKKKEALDDVKNYVKEQILKHVSQAKTPVMNGNWKQDLSKAYKKIKGEQSSVSKANLELSGEMLDALEVNEVNSEKLVIQIAGEQAGKADGNNRGTYGKSKPNPAIARNFIPQEGQELNRTIQSGIKKILQEYEE